MLFLCKPSILWEGRSLINSSASDLPWHIEYPERRGEILFADCIGFCITHLSPIRAGHKFSLFRHEIRGPFQYSIKHLIVRFRIILNPRDGVFKCSYCFEIWQAPRRHIKEKMGNYKQRSGVFETLWDTSHVILKQLGPVFCLMLGVSSGCAWPITGQVTSVTWPVIGWA